MSNDGVALRCDPEKFSAAWSAIKVPDGIKERLLNQSLLSFTVRQKLPYEIAPLHGFVLLVGPPGTGKTTLARGLAHQIAKRLKGRKTTFLQIDPHALTGSNLGSSQKAVTKLFEQTLPEAAINGVAIVLLDEVEALAPARHKLSLEANPVDVHRATNAVLTGLDSLSRENKNVLLLGTSNFVAALDPALISRADAVEDIGLPEEHARKEIVADTIAGIAREWPSAARLASEAAHLAKECAGLDGRAIRKAIIAAAARDIETAQDLGRLKRADIEASFQQALKNQKAITS